MIPQKFDAVRILCNKIDRQTGKQTDEQTDNVCVEVSGFVGVMKPLNMEDFYCANYLIITLFKQESTQTLGILTAVLTNLIDKLTYLFVHVNGAVTITAVLKTLAPALVRYIQNSHTR